MMTKTRPQQATGVTRWGASRAVDVDASSSKPEGQFVDVALNIPEAVEISFYATSDLPLAGLSVLWKLNVGVGSTNHTESFTQNVRDVNAQTPVALRRAAQRIQISATVINTNPEPRNVEIVAMVSPQFAADCMGLR